MFNGSLDEGKRLIKPLLDTEDAEQDVEWRRGTYMDLNGTLNSDPPVPDVVTHTRTQADSRYVERQLKVEEWARLARFFQQSPNRGNFVGLEAYGGAIGKLAPDETAFLHRRATFDVYIWVFWLDDAEEQQSLEFLKEFRTVMEGIGNGHAYQNYPNRANSKYHRMYWGSNLERLQAIKRDCDPQNLFSFGQSVLSPRVHGASKLGDAAVVRQKRRQIAERAHHPTVR
jgi:FAD/FMN-containing dehydrogenase